MPSMFSPTLHLGVHAIVLLAFLHIAVAALVNVTIDDTFGDPETGAQVTYLPAGAWSAGSQSQSCPTCVVHPATNQLYDGTWHESSYNASLENVSNEIPSASVSFNGSAIYVYAAIAQSSNLSEAPYLTFLIDDKQVGAYTGNPTQGAQLFQYQVPVYVNLSVSPGLHTFTVQNGRQGGPASIIILDSIVYTTSIEDDAIPPVAKNGHSRRTAILGGALGGTLGFIMICVTTFIFIQVHRRRRRRRLAPSQQYADSKWREEGNMSPLSIARPLSGIQSITARPSVTERLDDDFSPPPILRAPSDAHTIVEPVTDIPAFPLHPPRTHYPETLRRFLTGDTPSDVESSHPSTIYPGPPMTPGIKAFRVVNR